eukprot:SAG31_NODE_9335_length_1291_cov_1.299331_1_plen_69_part_00
MLISTGYSCTRLQVKLWPETFYRIVISKYEDIFRLALQGEPVSIISIWLGAAGRGAAAAARALSKFRF